MAKAKTTHPRQRAILGIVAVILIVVFTNWLMRSTSLGSSNLDMTEDKRYTLTDGTKAILGELDSPVIIRYYATRDSKVMPQQVRNYMRTVDGMLTRYEDLSDGKIRIEQLDPQPDTDAEDSANLDGISGQRINDENLYFGLAISCLDQQTSIPFLNPSDETMLEYNLSSAIANVSTFEKPKVGIMSALPIMGSPAQMPGQQPQQPWIIYQLLRQLYDVQYIGTTPTSLDPEELPVLLMIHPAGLSTQTEFLIDQYVLKGGIVVACLDPFALTAPAGNPMMRGMGGVAKSSSLPSLLEAWGVGFDATSVVADGKYATDFGNGQRMHSHLSLTSDAITSDDEILTRGFENLYFPLPGGFTIKGGGGISIETLIRTSKEVIPVAGMTATRPDPGLFARKSPTGKHYGLVMRLKGKFKTAFPEGDPSKDKQDDKDKQEPEKNEQAENEPEALKNATQEGIVYLIADADFVFDRASFQQTNQGYIAINNNAALLQNILDQSTGSRHLIGSRSRAATTRPFTVIKEMETDFEQEIRDDVKKAEEKMQNIVSELQKLQTQKTQGKALILSPEQEQKIRELQTQQVNLRRELREKQKGLKTKKDELYSKLTWMTVAITPIFIALTGLGVWIFRRRSTRAV
ncbi:MAG: Gldg family protein [Akkermansiaceae bacterium]